MDKRQRIATFGTAAVAVLLGAAAPFVIGGTTGAALGVALVTLGLVAAISLVFFEIGLSEDRERAREARQKRLEAAQAGRRRLLWRRRRG